MLLIDPPHHQSHGQQEGEERSLNQSSSTRRCGAGKQLVVYDIYTQPRIAHITADFHSEVPKVQELHLAFFFVELKRMLGCGITSLIHLSVRRVVNHKRVEAAVSDADLQVRAEAHGFVLHSDPWDRRSHHIHETWQKFYK